MYRKRHSSKYIYSYQYLFDAKMQEPITNIPFWQKKEMMWKWRKNVVCGFHLSTQITLCNRCTWSVKKCNRKYANAFSLCFGSYIKRTMITSSSYIDQYVIAIKIWYSFWIVQNKIQEIKRNNFIPWIESKFHRLSDFLKTHLIKVYKAI